MGNNLILPLKKINYDVLMPLQPYGLGDIIILQELVIQMAEDRKVIWGVRPELVNQLNQAYPRFTFISWEYLNIDYNNHNDEIHDRVRIAPISHAYIMRDEPESHWATAKYALYDVPFYEWNSWRAQPDRDAHREKALFKILGIRPTDEYILVNEYYRFGEKREIDLDRVVYYGMKAIRMSNIPGFSAFDWMGVMENCFAFHEVSTSTTILWELASTKGDHHLYKRPTQNHGEEYYSDFITKPYVWHD